MDAPLKGGKRGGRGAAGPDPHSYAGLLNLGKINKTYFKLRYCKELSLFRGKSGFSPLKLDIFKFLCLGQCKKR